MMTSNGSTRNTDYKALQGNTCLCLYILVWISYSRPPLYHWQYYINKRQRIPKGQSKKDNPEKMAKQGTQDEEKQKHNTICIGHHYKQ